MTQDCGVIVREWRTTMPVENNEEDVAGMHVTRIIT